MNHNNHTKHKQKLINFFLINFKIINCILIVFVLVFNDGTPMELVNLSGTIPVTYKGKFSGIIFKKYLLFIFLGNVYNIPVCIWLMDTHPNNAPLCYVKPTSDMNIKVSIFVDQNGKIYLPYLHDWVPVSLTYKYTNIIKSSGI